MACVSTGLATGCVLLQQLVWLLLATTHGVAGQQAAAATEQDSRQPLQPLVTPDAGVGAASNSGSSRVIMADDGTARMYGHSSGYGGGNSLDLYSALAIFSFAIFLGYLLYNYISQQQANARDSNLWTVWNTQDTQYGSQLAGMVVTAIERFSSIFDDHEPVAEIVERRTL